MLELLNQIVLILAREMRGPRHCGEPLWTMAIGAKLHCLPFRNRGLVGMRSFPNARNAERYKYRDRRGAAPDAGASLHDTGAATDNTGIASDLTGVDAQRAKVPYQGTRRKQDCSEKSWQREDGFADHTSASKPRC